MTMIRDVVFDQHYAKKVSAMIQQAGQDGFNQGFAHCLSIIAHFNEMEMPITPKTIQLFLQGQQNMEMKKAEARHKAKNNQGPNANPCGEIPLPTTSQPEQPEPPKKPSFTVVK